MSRLKTIVAALLILWLSTTVAQPSNKSAAYTKPYQKNALVIFRELISRRTARGHGQIPGMAKFLQKQFLDGGFSKKDIHLIPFTLDDGEASAGLVVRYRGDGSSGKRPILFNAHMDVVDALPKDWERDPFELIEEDGYFFGRGTIDNKMGIAMMTATFLRLKAEGFVPTRDLIIMFNGDEETGMDITRQLVTDYRELTDAEFALNTDAGGGTFDEDGKALFYMLQTSEKTYATFQLTVRNPGGHSSMPRADNAIYELADALKRIQALRFPVRFNETTRTYFKLSGKVMSGDVGEAMLRFAANPQDEEAADILSREPEHVGIVRTTCVATMLSAGHAENALPQSASATINCRIFPGVKVAEVQTRLQQAIDNSNIDLAVLGEPKASPASPLRKDVVHAVSKAVDTLFPGTPVIPFQAPYGTDGLEIRFAGIPTYGVSGIFIREQDAFAHGLNERVEVRAFFSALEYWQLLITELAGR